MGFKLFAHFASDHLIIGIFWTIFAGIVPLVNGDGPMDPRWNSKRLLGDISDFKAEPLSARFNDHAELDQLLAIVDDEKEMSHNLLTLVNPITSAFLYFNEQYTGKLNVNVGSLKNEEKFLQNFTKSLVKCKKSFNKSKQFSEEFIEAHSSLIKWQLDDLEFLLLMHMIADPKVKRCGNLLPLKQNMPFLVADYPGLGPLLGEKESSDIWSLFFWAMIVLLLVILIVMAVCYICKIQNLNTKQPQQQQKQKQHQKRGKSQSSKTSQTSNKVNTSLSNIGSSRPGSSGPKSTIIVPARMNSKSEIPKQSSSRINEDKSTQSAIEELHQKQKQKQQQEQEKQQKSQNDKSPKMGQKTSDTK